MNHAITLLGRLWRPLLGVTLVEVVFVNGVVLPLITHQVADLAALITAVVGAVPLIAARSVEKIKGVTT